MHAPPPFVASAPAQPRLSLRGSHKAHPLLSSLAGAARLTASQRRARLDRVGERLLALAEPAPAPTWTPATAARSRRPAVSALTAVVGALARSRGRPAVVRRRQRRRGRHCQRAAARAAARLRPGCCRASPRPRPPAAASARPPWAAPPRRILRAAAAARAPRLGRRRTATRCCRPAAAAAAAAAAAVAVAAARLGASGQRAVATTATTARSARWRRTRPWGTAAAAAVAAIAPVAPPAGARRTGAPRRRSRRTPRCRRWAARDVMWRCGHRICQHAGTNHHHNHTPHSQSV